MEQKDVKTTPVGFANGCKVGLDFTVNQMLVHSTWRQREVKSTEAKPSRIIV